METVYSAYTDKKSVFVIGEKHGKPLNSAHTDCWSVSNGGEQWLESAFRTTFGCGRI